MRGPSLSRCKSDVIFIRSGGENKDFGPPNHEAHNRSSWSDTIRVNQASSIMIIDMVPLFRFL